MEMLKLAVKLGKELKSYLSLAQNFKSYSLKRELFNLVYEWSIFGGAEGVDLETFLKKAKQGYENNYQQWNLLIAGVEKRFIENNYEIFDDDDAQLASLQRSIDPNFCSRPPQLRRTRQSKSVAKSASPNFEVNIDGEIQEHPDAPVGANISPLPR
uniref:Uncharacterized protein n=1 Tax=Panagrolaimus superbus TaxID=310955 RepID=A0A914YDM6_9BILA